MSKYLELSEEEKIRIREQHKNAVRNVNDRKDTLKKGLQKKNNPKEEEKK